MPLVKLVARLYLWATERLYHELAWAYDTVSWLVSLGRWSRWRRMALDYVAGGRVLEVGFGTGELLSEMARQELQGIGLDPSPAMHRVTARKLQRRGLAVPRVRAIGQRAPFAAGCFDAVVSTFPAGYILDSETLHEAARLLRTPDIGTGDGGGRLIVVGMVVEMDSQLLRRAVRLLFGAPVESVVARFDTMAETAGLRVRFVQRDGGWVHVPVLIAEKVA
jgi:ubiquinone/menaquinone biosynthesis C-methylase UbiE